MITIIVKTMEEYEKVMRDIHLYVCKKIPYKTCIKYSYLNGCYDCIKDNHVNYGIKVILVDKPLSNPL